MILQITLEGRPCKVRFERNGADGSFVCEIDGERISGSARLLEPGILSVLLGDVSYRCVLDEGAEEPGIYVNGVRRGFQLEDPRSLRSRRSHGVIGGGPKSLKAPMPGRIVRILATEGSQVEARQGILVIEAMKMQNEIKAPKTGKLVELKAVAGSTVNAGDVLAIIE
jgi:biotin carboxyl carrier protein